MKCVITLMACFELLAGTVPQCSSIVDHMSFVYVEHIVCVMYGGRGGGFLFLNKFANSNKPPPHSVPNDHPVR